MIFNQTRANEGNTMGGSQLQNSNNLVDPAAVASLLEMGYKKEEIDNALELFQQRHGKSSRPVLHA